MEHSHGHGAPAQALNESELLHSHGADPLSYIVHDLWPDVDRDSDAWPSLMVLHVVALSLAFFVFLPISISLRSVKHRWHRVACVAFHVSLGLGLFAATLYRKVTPNLYEGSTHGRMGYAVVAVVVGLCIAEFLGLVRRLVSFFVSSPPSQWSLGGFKRALFDTESDDLHALPTEYVGLVQADDDVHEETLEAHPGADIALTQVRPHVAISHSRSHSLTSTEDLEHAPTARWVRGQTLPYNLAVNHSDLTLHDSAATPTFKKHFMLPQAKVSFRARLHTTGNVIFHVLEHALVPFAFAEAVSGITIYTGTCRGNYFNGCLAHLVKGGIFWCYGLLSFARYLGAWSKLGWAWNRRADSSPSWTPSAEMVESFVIFLYGASNTWMERFGAQPGDPYTTKQVQHISIAVMFWFAGLIGMAIESRTIRRWLSQSAPSAADQQVEGPSFNPLPGLVIGVTGLAMSAHHQAYVFLVQIHTLWGTMLAAFAAFRWLTYFLLWTKNRTGRSPMANIEPSRPPTEVLASFFLACGGLVFALSMEQVGFAAMRAGHDDVMMFLNLAVAVTCLAFAWLVGILAFNGYVKTKHAAALAVHRPQLGRSDSS
ncbi:hypothetical protein EXIGLDRAFT_599150 [Exidia glandulosa HHB12029]|uniref:Protein YTP1-like C-terminal domain-containing protein n=1 Tax=Exidia glandulosa HHB12029 TaxID=1314781 RepID=A0A165R3F1_EXIGL|nr:hypothetical protein EXIGLDRAFT_599150 [Exidia glandulosa HHB12029]